MLFNPLDLENEIRELHAKILERRRAFDEGMKNDMPFEQLKTIFVEIKELSKRQELCFEEVNAQR
jgi:hypothetical protein